MFNSYFATFTCCPPFVAILNCKAGVLRDSFRTRARVSQARVKRLCAAVNFFSQYIASGSDNNAENIAKITRSSQSRKGSRDLGVVSQSAADLNNYCNRIDILIPQFVQWTDKLESGYGPINEALVDRVHPSERSEIIATLRPSVEMFLSAFQFARIQFDRFREVAVKLNEHNLSREFNKAVNRLLSTIDAMLEVLREMESFGLRTMYQVEKLETVDNKGPN